MKNKDEFVIKPGDILILDKKNLIGNCNPETVLLVQIRQDKEDSDELTIMITGNETFQQIYCHEYKIVRNNKSIVKMAIECIKSMFGNEENKEVQ